MKCRTTPEGFGPRGFLFAQFRVEVGKVVKLYKVWCFILLDVQKFYLFVNSLLNFQKGGSILEAWNDWNRFQF